MAKPSPWCPHLSGHVDEVVTNIPALIMYTVFGTAELPETVGTPVQALCENDRKGDKMIFDNINLAELPESLEEAFIIYEKQVRDVYEGYARNDRDHETDQNGNYVGWYEPERDYIGCINAFIDETNLDINIPDISALNGQNYKLAFDDVKSKITYASMRFSLRKNRIEQGSAGTPITFKQDYKSEVGSLLETIRKIVNQEISDTKKKDAIFSKIASLQSEVDREQTTIDALFSRMIDLSNVVGECAENIEPLVNKLERIKKIFWDKSDKVELLSKKERQKLLPKESEAPNWGDEAPF
jgi:hypothetical protein